MHLHQDLREVNAEDYWLAESFYKCASLIMKRRLLGKNCNDLVGETADIMEAILQD